MTKDWLLEAIETNRRQLERYLVYFERGADGGFVPSARPKFDREEMIRPGVVAEWSLKDLVCHLIEWARRVSSW
jgi:hypothetical protein